MQNHQSGCVNKLTVGGRAFRNVSVTLKAKDLVSQNLEN